MHVTKLAAFTLAGMAYGFATSGLGALALHRGPHRGDDILDDAVVGAIGGTADGAVLGLLAASLPRVSVRNDLAELATSSLLVGAMGGVVGSVIVAQTQGAGHVDVRHALGVGLVGTLVSIAVGCGVSLVLCSCRLALCCCPGASHRVAEVQDALLGRRRVEVDDLAAQA